MSLSKYTTDTPLGKVDITKFDGTNYQRWSRQVRSALIAIDAWDLIEGGLDVPSEESPENERRRYRKLNNKGFSLIYNSVDEAIQICLDDTKDSCHTAWHLLRLLYSKEQTEETLERRNFGRDLEEEIEKWRRGRRATIKVMKELVDKLKQLDGFVDEIVFAGTAMRVAGNVMMIAGSVLEVFCPPARGVVGPLKAWGGGVDICGVLGVSFVKLYELGLSKKFLKDVGDTLKADIENTNEMIKKLIQIDGKMLYELYWGLPNFFRRRYGKKTVENKATGSERSGVPLWKNLSHAIGVPLVEWKGDSALSFVGVEEALRPACLHGALLAWNVYYLMTTRGLQSEAQYVTYAEGMLKNLVEELESSLPRDKND